MTSKVIQGLKSSSNFSVNPTLPLLDGPSMLPSPYCLEFSHSPSLHLFSLPRLSFTLSLYPSLPPSFAWGHMRPLLCRVIFNNFQIFWSNYNLVLTLTYVLTDNFLSLFILHACTLYIIYNVSGRSISKTLFCYDILGNIFLSSFCVTVDGFLTEYHNSDPKKNTTISTTSYILENLSLFFSPSYSASYCVSMDVFACVFKVS